MPLDFFLKNQNPVRYALDKKMELSPKGMCEAARDLHRALRAERSDRARWRKNGGELPDGMKKTKVEVFVEKTHLKICNNYAWVFRELENKKFRSGNVFISDVAIPFFIRKFEHIERDLETLVKEGRL